MNEAGQRIVRDDEALLREAIRLARARMLAGRGGPFGAVVARGGIIVAKGWNRVTTGMDPSAHAEIVAIRRACRRLGTYRLDGCILYSSCEPCPMCLAAAYWARLDRITWAASHQDAAAAGFDDELIYREVALPIAERTLPSTQLLRDEGASVFVDWLAYPERVPY
jgi:guanine deaminase